MEATTEAASAAKPKGRAKANGKAKVGLDAESLQKAKASACRALDEAWEQLQAAIHETAGTEPAGVSVALRYKPGKDTQNKSVPPRLEVIGRLNLPTNRETFAARDSGGQLALSAWYD